MIARRRTRTVSLGNVRLGSGFPVAIQTMTTGPSDDWARILDEVHQLTGLGADVVRLAVSNPRDSRALARICAASPVPIIADVHFSSRRALDAIESGAQGIRLDPGNIRDKKQIQTIGREAAASGACVRVGVNSGSVDPQFLAIHGGPTVEALVASALHYLTMLEEVGLTNLKVSVKSSSVRANIKANQLIANEGDWPLHLGVTEAGPLPMAAVKATAGVSPLLIQGIGDTLRLSITGERSDELALAVGLLESLDLRPRTTVDVVSCPSCGRADVDVLRLAGEVASALDGRSTGVRVAVMGCEVNGPGEARSADVALVGGRGAFHIYVRGELRMTVPEERAVASLLEVKSELDDQDLADDGLAPPRQEALWHPAIRRAHFSGGGGVASRACIFSPSGRVLLLHYREPSTNQEVWALPGGLCEHGESALETVIREVQEETGWVLRGPGLAMGSYRASYRWKRVSYSRLEWLTAFEVPYEFEVNTLPGDASDEAAMYCGFRWWDLVELESSREAVHPSALAVMARQYLAGGVA